jgi:hypothetical protein
MFFDPFEKGKEVSEMVSIKILCVLGNKYFAEEA